MLMRALMRAALVMVAAVTVTGSWQVPASAKGDPPGGGLGGTQCGQSYTPGCTVTAGTPGSSGPGSPGENVPGSGTLAAARPGGGLRGHGEQGVRLRPGRLHDHGPRPWPARSAWARPPARGPPAPPAASGAGPARGAVPAAARSGDPLVPGARRAAADPIAHMAMGRPRRLASGVEDSTGPRRVGHRDRDPGVGVLADGRRQDGHLPQGPGTAYTGRDNPASPSPTCGYTYTRSSAGQPRAAYHVTVTITWDITWTGPAGPAGRCRRCSPPPQPPCEWLNHRQSTPPEVRDGNADRAPPGGRRPGRRARLTAATAPQLGTGRDRRPGGGGVRAGLRGGWVQAGNRKPVLAVVHDVAAGQLLTAADLQVVRVSASGPVSLVPAAGEASVLGSPAPGRCRRAPC